ncbi:MAG: 3-hydroxybutyryl-CoA dehydrogenase [Roseiflexaceae bacterium]
MEIRTVGVIGCGLMGSGIAQACAQAGYTTLVREVTPELLEQGMARLNRSLARAKISDDERSAALSRITPTTALADLAGCDLIIEAIVENLPAKRELYAELDQICPPETIFASNTSAISIIDMAVATSRADRFAGLHFFNPVPVMKLVELVRSIATSQATVDTLRAFGEALGKTVVQAKDMPGFIVNRLLIPYLIDAVRLLEGGLATREEIDAGMKLGCSHPMGPLELLDFVGLDTAFYVALVMYEEFKEPRFAPPPLLKQMVAAGYLGRKSGRGFYEYS